MKPERNYRIGAVGAGSMGIGHVRSIAASPRWEICYVCDLSEERLELAREIAPEAKLTMDFEEIIADPSIDAVSINTLSNVRPMIVRKAVAAGKHVLCEKPLAPTAAEARRLLADVASADTLITINLFNRNAAYLRRALDFIRDGEIGELAIIRLNHCTPGGRAEYRHLDTHKAVEGHVLHDCGMHYVDVMRWFAGSEYREFDAGAVRFWDKEFDLHFMVKGSFENNIVFELHNSFCYTTLSMDRRNYSSQEFIGTHGVITLTHDFKTVTLKMNGRNRTVSDTMPYGGKKLDVYYAEFAHALDNGDLGQLPRVDDAVKASETAQAMVQQALSRPVPNFGRPEDIDSRRKS